MARRWRRRWRLRFWNATGACFVASLIVLGAVVDAGLWVADRVPWRR